MNRLMLFYIFKNVIEKYIETNEVTAEDFRKIVDNTPSEEYDEDKAAYVESILIMYIFEKIPYYKIMNTLDTLTKKLVKECSSRDYYNITSKILRDGCFAEIIPNINRRIETETMLHVLELAHFYYQDGNFDNVGLNNRLVVNICDPESLTGADIAENYLKYSQEAIFVSEKDNLRDDISKNNAGFKRDVTNILKEKVLRCFTPDTLEEFMCELEKFIKASNIEESELLLDLISNVNQKLLIYAISKWEATKEEGYQLTLQDYLH